MTKRPSTERAFKSFTSQTMKSKPAKTETDERSYTRCKSHPNKYVLLYCSFCEKPVCDKCKVTTHARHVTDVKGNEALLSAAKSRRRYLVRLLDAKQKKIIPALKDSIMQIVESKSKLQNRLEIATEKYQHYAKMHRDKLTLSEEEWIGDVMHRASRFYQLMDEKVDFLKRKLFDVTSTLGLIYDELKEENHPELLLMFGVLRSGLENLHALKWPHEEISVTLKMELVPEFGAVSLKQEDTFDKNCYLDFSQDIIQPVVYSRVFDTTIPVPKKVLKDEHAKISVASADELFVAFGEYIVTYPLDNRRYAKASSNIRLNTVITVRQNIIDITCDPNGDLYFAVHNAIKKVPCTAKKIQKSFSLSLLPSAICISSPVDGPTAIFVGFHDAGKIVKYSLTGKVIMELTHPDPKMVYRPRHLAINYVGDIFFSDDISNVTVLDTNGIWKGAIVRDVKAPPASRLLRPTGITCTTQRHVLIIDANAATNIHVFSEDGKYLQTAVFKNIHDAYVLTVDKTEDVWVAYKDGRLRIYRPRYITSDVM